MLSVHKNFVQSMGRAVSPSTSMYGLELSVDACF